MIGDNQILDFANIIGKDLLSNSGVVSSEKALTSRVLGLYFSAHWCGPCQQFTPMLKNFYENLVGMGADFEIIFISSDHDENTYQKYFGEMPWVAIPYGDSRLATIKTKFRVTSIPSLVLLDPTTGKILSLEGRDLVAEEDINKILDWCGIN